jgi:hypothetical protein
MPFCPELRSGAIYQAVDKVENMALERKNRCGTECITSHAFSCRVCKGGMKALPVLLPGKCILPCDVCCAKNVCGGAEICFLHGRKAKLENAVKVKERLLQTQHNKPDPLQGTAGLQKDITRLNGQIETAVSSPCPLASRQRPRQHSDKMILCTSPGTAAAMQPLDRIYIKGWDWLAACAGEEAARRL